jgi:hypothetical protein
MPYGNFDDNYATRILYNQQQNQDPDLTLGEFIFDRLLWVGELFDDDDDDDENTIPLKSPEPIQSLHIQAGFLECYKPAIKVQEIQEPAVKPTCLFKETKLSREFSSSIFHPPAFSTNIYAC